MDVDYSSLSDHELSRMLKDYGVDVGPINVATRKSYERKLHKLKTGEIMPASQKYEPVANDEDDDDNEVQFKRSQPQYKAPTPKVINRTPVPTQPRQRRDPADTYTPVIDSRPSLNSARKTTLSYDSHRPDPRPSTKQSVKDDQEQSNGIPLWVKLVAVFVAVALFYLIYSNMESNAASNIPKIPSKMEV